MEGRALAWFQWMTSNDQLTFWHVFLQALQTYFAPSQYEDPTGALFKLTQRNTANAYLSEFEDLANRIIGHPHHFFWIALFLAWPRRFAARFNPYNHWRWFRRPAWPYFRKRNSLIVDVRSVAECPFHHQKPNHLFLPPLDQTPHPCYPLLRNHFLHFL